MTSSNLRQTEGGIGSCLAPQLPSWALIFAILAFGVLPRRLTAQEALSCGEPERADGRSALVRCRLEGSKRESVWEVSNGASSVPCLAVAPGAELPASDAVRCGQVGDEVWFWRSVREPVRGALRYRSWSRDGLWYLDAAELLPALIRANGIHVEQGRWLDGAAERREAYAAMRSRVWLLGSDAGTLDGSISIVAEPAVARFMEPVRTALLGLRQRGWGLEVKEVVILRASRSDYGSGRSLRGQIVLEVGTALGRSRLEALLQHELAHQLVGGDIRLLRDGEDVGWFLEGFAEYLGYAMVRDEPSGRAALLGRFAEACGAATATEGLPSDYDLGFLYAAAADGALWRSQRLTLERRLRGMLQAGGGEVVFGGRSDFVGTEPRADFLSALLSGSDPTDHAALRDWTALSARPDVSKLAESLGVVLARERVAWTDLPVRMRERQDGLFVVERMAARAASGVAPGDLLWPLEPWSGPAVGQQVAVEVGHAGAWRPVRLPTVRGSRERWRVVAADGVEARWFGEPESGGSR